MKLGKHRPRVLPPQSRTPIVSNTFKMLDAAVSFQAKRVTEIDGKAYVFPKFYDHTSALSKSVIRTFPLPSQYRRQRKRVETGTMVRVNVVHAGHHVFHQYFI